MRQESEDELSTEVVNHVVGERSSPYMLSGFVYTVSNKSQENTSTTSTSMIDEDNGALTTTSGDDSASSTLTATIGIESGIVEGSSF